MLTDKDKVWITKMLWLTAQIIMTMGFRREFVDFDTETRKAFFEASAKF